MKKVAGTTLIESLVATIIILSVVGISSVIIAGSLRSHTSMPGIIAISASDSLCEQIIRDGSFSDREFSQNGLNFSVTFSTYSYSRNILKMNVVATNGLNQKIGSFNYLIPDY
ncbi:hypothetical protein SDC9_50346 [bioreactor metagenome]|uniref:Type II secretion system protein n=1 Tax=bioreactor metagenome TaxID=1076179 RepID=A0A644WJL8_9ZZZZ